LSCDVKEISSTKDYSQMGYYRKAITEPIKEVFLSTFAELSEIYEESRRNIDNLIKL